MLKVSWYHWWLYSYLYVGLLGKKEDNLDEAINDFTSILDLEQEKGDWGFKALKQCKWWFHIIE